MAPDEVEDLLDGVELRGFDGEEEHGDGELEEDVGVELKVERLVSYSMGPALDMLERCTCCFKYVVLATLLGVALVLYATRAENGSKGHQVSQPKGNENAESEDGAYEYGAKETEVVLKGLFLDQEMFEKIDQVVLGVGEENQVIAKFTVYEARKERRDMCLDVREVMFLVKARRMESDEELASVGMAEHVGCVVSFQKTHAWHFFVAVLEHLPKNAMMKYAIGQMFVPGEGAKYNTNGIFQSTFRTFPESKDEIQVLVVGDTGSKGRGAVFSKMATYIPSAHLLIHLGDMSYATDDGDCFDSKYGDPQCSFDCKAANPTCRGKNRCSDSVFEMWKQFFDEFQPISSQVPVITTMGNFDNDLIWFFKFRPPHTSTFPAVHPEVDLSPFVREKIQLFQTNLQGKPMEQQQSYLNELLSNPLFYSVKVGPFHIISLQSEDNAVNPYETSSKESMKNETAIDNRFACHFGPSSKQMSWFHRT